VDNPEFDKQTIIDFHETFNTVHGKRVLIRMKKYFHYNESVNYKGVDGHIDPYALAAQAAQNDIFIYIDKKLEKKG